MRYFQLINPIRNQYPLVGEKEIYVEENGVQTLILKRDIIANFPNETMEIAHDISLEEVLKDLLKKQSELNSELGSITNQINSYKDGFDYVVCVHSYGSHNKYKFNNLYAALELTNDYNQDNGFAHLFTNNPNVKIRLYSGDVFFIENTSEISAYNHPKNAVIVYADEDLNEYSQEDLQNESDLNSLENQSNEC